MAKKTSGSRNKSKTGKSTAMGLNKTNAKGKAKPKTRGAAG